MRLSTIERHIEAVLEPSDAKRVTEHLERTLGVLNRKLNRTEESISGDLREVIPQYAALLKDAKLENEKAEAMLKELDAYNHYKVAKKQLDEQLEYALFTLTNVHLLGADRPYGDKGLQYGDFVKYSVNVWEYVTIGCKLVMTKDGYKQGSYAVVITTGDDLKIHKDSDPLNQRPDTLGLRSLYQIPDFSKIRK